jgi:hypothetical protein
VFVSQSMDGVIYVARRSVNRTGRRILIFEM